jgi:hypothetical protein
MVATARARTSPACLTRCASWRRTCVTAARPDSWEGGAFTEITNPATEQWQPLMADHDAASDAYGKTSGGSNSEEAERFNTAFDALIRARPTDPAVMAAQLRFVIRDTDLE